MAVISIRGYSNGRCGHEVCLTQVYIRRLCSMESKRRLRSRMTDRRGEKRGKRGKACSKLSDGSFRALALAVSPEMDS
jgi:hypothetical protein